MPYASFVSSQKNKTKKKTWALNNKQFILSTKCHLAANISSHKNPAGLTFRSCKSQEDNKFWTKIIKDIPENHQTATTKSSHSTYYIYILRVFQLPLQSCGFPRGMPGYYQSRPHKYRSTGQRNVGKWSWSFWTVRPKQINPFNDWVS